jgi:anti-sigma factor RsiW
MPDLDGSLCDAEAARLLPWFVNGRLSGEDTVRVTEHLEHCAICRADLAEQQTLRATIKTAGPIEYAPQAGLARTLMRIDELTREAGPTAGSAPAEDVGPVPQRRPVLVQWLVAAVIVQAVGLGTLGALLFRQSPGQEETTRYETRATPGPAAAGARIRAVFSPSMTTDQLRTLLNDHGLGIVAGPTGAGVFTLGEIAAPSRQHTLESTLAALRSDARVLFAEPATGSDALSP